MGDHVKLIAEAIAGDICDAGYLLTEAKRVLAFLDAEGLVIVPREPTEKMITTALEHEYIRHPIPSDVEFVYRAMLAAAGGDDG